MPSNIASNSPPAYPSAVAMGRAGSSRASTPSGSEPKFKPDDIANAPAALSSGKTEKSRPSNCFSGIKNLLGIGSATKVNTGKLEPTTLLRLGYHSTDMKTAISFSQKGVQERIPTDQQCLNMAGGKLCVAGVASGALNYVGRHLQQLGDVAAVLKVKHENPQFTLKEGIDSGQLEKISGNGKDYEIAIADDLLSQLRVEWHALCCVEKGVLVEYRVLDSRATDEPGQGRRLEFRVENPSNTRVSERAIFNMTGRCLSWNTEFE